MSKAKRAEPINSNSISDEISSSEYNHLKVQLQYISNRKRSKGLLIFLFSVSMLVSVLIGFFMTESLFYKLNITTIIISLAIGLLVGCLLLAYFTMIYEMQENSIRKEIFDYEALHMQDKVDEDIFENSIKMSYKYLDQYYLQTREHAQRGFFVTVCVSVLGAILIGIGVIAMFLDRVAPSYITCASGVITEFIAAIFFYLYNKTIASMSRYHNKLVLSQNISIALKVADSLPTDDKVKAKNSIVNELLKDINTYLLKEDSVVK